jgi:hypothetical protein
MPVCWNACLKDWAQRYKLDGDFAIFTERPSAAQPEINHRMEIVNL